jgi:RyR domain
MEEFVEKYEPRPVDTTTIKLDAEILELAELLAANAHDVWATRRMAEGWEWGPRRCDSTKKHPCLLPYSALPESEKEYDRSMALETIKVLVALGYHVTKSA